MYFYDAYFEMKENKILPFGKIKKKKTGTFFDQ